jgi:hypothetical protein
MFSTPTPVPELLAEILMLAPTILPVAVTVPLRTLPVVLKFWVALNAAASMLPVALTLSLLLMLPPVTLPVVLTPAAAGTHST